MVVWWRHKKWNHFTHKKFSSFQFFCYLHSLIFFYYSYFLFHCLAQLLTWIELKYIFFSSFTISSSRSFILSRTKRILSHFMVCFLLNKAKKLCHNISSFNMGGNLTTTSVLLTTYGKFKMRYASYLHALDRKRKKDCNVLKSFLVYFPHFPCFFFLYLKRV